MRTKVIQPQFPRHFRGNVVKGVVTLFLRPHELSCLAEPALWLLPHCRKSMLKACLVQTHVVEAMERASPSCLGDLWANGAHEGK